MTDPSWVRFTYPFNMTRSPAATVCAGLTGDGLPVGLQLVGPQHADLVVLRSAAALETALGLRRGGPGRHGDPMSSGRPGTELAAALDDPATYTGDPAPLFARLRAEAPMAWHEDPGTGW